MIIKQIKYYLSKKFEKKKFQFFFQKFSISIFRPEIGRPDPRTPKTHKYFKKTQKTRKKQKICHSEYTNNLKNTETAHK